MVRVTRLINCILRAGAGTPDVMFCVRLIRAGETPANSKDLYRLLVMAHRYRRRLPADLVPPYKPPPLQPLGEFFAELVFCHIGRLPLADAIRKATEEFGPATAYWTHPPRGALTALAERI